MGKMTLTWRCWKLGLASLLAMGGAIADFGDYTKAQITPDGTLGTESSVVTPTTNNGLLGEQISGGAIRGTNLFHSFEQFSVPTGSAAYFNNALGIQNIISRVTGSSISKIDGLIQANGTANLFLLNPNGIIFGPNASLNIGGSFLGSTASGLNFADGTQFSATAPQTTPLLIVSVPIGLQYGGIAGSILNQSQATDSSGELVGFQVQPGKSLALVGGDVALDGGVLQAPGGRVDLGGVVGVGTVGLNVDGNNLRLSFPDGVPRADVSLTNGSFVDASGEGGSDIHVQGGGVTLNDNSAILANTLGSQNGGGIFIRAEQLNIRGASGVNANTFSSGAGGNVSIETGKLFVRDGAYVSTRTFAQGPGGTLTVAASESVALIGTSADGQVPSGLFTRTEDAGSAGKLTIETGQLIVQDGAQVVAGAGIRSTGQGGALGVTASESVELTGESVDGSIDSGLFAQTEGVGSAGDLTIATRKLIVQNGATVSSDTLAKGPGGAAGDLTIATEKLIIQNGATVSSDTFGEGLGGTLTVTASESVELIGTSPYNQLPSLLSTSSATGAGGNLTLETRRLIIRDGSRIQAGTFGTGRGGTLAVTASESVELSGTLASDSRFVSGLITSVQPRATGAGGNLTLETRRLIIRAGAAVSTGTFGEGSSGILAVNASEMVELIGTSADGQGASRLSARTLSTGDAGDLTVATEHLSVRDGARVIVSSEGSGEAGQLTVQARSIQLDNQGAITATTNSGNGGDVTLRSQDLMLLRRNSNISTRAGTPETGGTGGSITIETDNLVALENSDIDANAFGGAGGQVTINTQGIFGTQGREQLTSDSDITASSNLGPQFSGTVEINTSDIDPSRGLVNLPAELVNIIGLISQSCPGGGGTVGRGKSEFIITGRGGLPPNPSEALRSDAVRVDWNTPIQGQENRASAAVSTNSTRVSAPTPLVEAQGWVIGANGEVILTARPPTVTPHSPWLAAVDCHTPQTS